MKKILLFFIIAGPMVSDGYSQQPRLQGYLKELFAGPGDSLKNPAWLSHPMSIKSFYIDIYPVTNSQFKRFIDLTHYHPRAAVLKGGSCYKPKGNYYSGQTPSGWYFPWANDLIDYGKYLLLSPGMDRSATIGFRCVKDR